MCDWFDDAVFAERDYSTPESYVAQRNVPMFAAISGENYVMCPSGWGDGRYPVFATRTRTASSAQSTSTSKWSTTAPRTTTPTKVKKPED